MKNKTKISQAKKGTITLWIFILFAVVLLQLPLDSAYGGAAGLVPCGNSSNYTDRCTLCHIIVGIKGLIDYGFNILIFVAILMLVVAGVMYIVSAGSTEMINSAKGIMKNTLFGFAFVLGAWLVINYTMIVLGTESNLGIQQVTGSWSDFRCDTTGS